MTDLPQGNKSRVELINGGAHVKKTYNSIGGRREKFSRELGFYLHYADADLIPKLIDYAQDEYIVLEWIDAQRLCDIQHMLGDSERKLLTNDYAEKIVMLFANHALSSGFKENLYQDRGANENRDEVIQQLQLNASSSEDCREIFEPIIESVSLVRLSEEVLIKLDWNPANTFLKQGSIFKFVDFEQSLIGTKELLTGILLHNPIWCPITLYHRLSREGFISVEIDDLIHYMNFSFGIFFVDSFTRTGRAWEKTRLVKAYKRHVLHRHYEMIKSA